MELTVHTQSCRQHRSVRPLFDLFQSHARLLYRVLVVVRVRPPTDPHENAPRYASYCTSGQNLLRFPVRAHQTDGTPAEGSRTSPPQGPVPGLKHTPKLTPPARSNSNTRQRAPESEQYYILPGAPIEPVPRGVRACVLAAGPGGRTPPLQTDAYNAAAATAVRLTRNSYIPPSPYLKQTRSRAAEGAITS